MKPCNKNRGNRNSKVYFAIAVVTFCLSGLYMLIWQNRNPYAASTLIMDSMVTVLVNLTEPVKEIKDVPSEVTGYTSIPNSKPLHLHCDVCALVSSSGHLLHTGAGQEIDNSTCVIRMNSAPTRGYEKDVGSRTDIRVIGYMNLIRQPTFRIDERYQNWMFDSNLTRTKYVIFHWGHSRAYVGNNMKKLPDYRVLWFFSWWYPHVKFYSFNAQKAKLSAAAVKNITQGKKGFSAKFVPSTGWFSMLFAMDVCEQINIYGMIPDWYCSVKREQKNKVPYHYYGGRLGGKSAECSYINAHETAARSTHRMATEKTVFAQWAKSRGNMSFFYPSWDNSPNQTLSNDMAPAFLQKLIGKPTKPTNHTDMENNGTAPVVKRRPKKIIVIKKIIKKANGEREVKIIRKPVY